MNISDLKRMKKEAGLTNSDIAELSGIPVSTETQNKMSGTVNTR